MHFEIHLTVRTRNIEQFRKDCEIIGVKPIIIDTGVGEQVTTSSKHSKKNYKKKLRKLTKKLTSLDYVVQRQKVEIMPNQIQHKKFRYYESHFRLKLNKEFNPETLDKICRIHDFHKSRNLFKKDDSFSYQMITFRTKILDFNSFKNRMDKFKLIMDRNNILYDKVEIEECVLDTNENIDSNWLSANVTSK